MSNNIPVGKTTVHLLLDKWEKHGRLRYQITILCDDNPFSDFDGLRDSIPTVEEVKQAIDCIIDEENQQGMAGYTNEQIIVLQQRIEEFVNKCLDYSPR